MKLLEGGIKIILNPLEWRLESRLFMIALVVGCYMYLHTNTTQLQIIERVHAEGPHRMVVVDENKRYASILFQDSVTGGLVFCAVSACVALPPEKQNERRPDIR
jgi:hypothetical protein